jgi:hypothetical protein
VIDDQTLEQTVRDSLHDAADHARLAAGAPLADVPAPVATRHSRRRPLLAAAAIVIGLALVVTVVIATRDHGDGVRVGSPAGDGSRVLSPDQLPHEKADLEVFMAVQATDDEVAAVLAEVDASPDVVQYAFLDHDAAYEEFRTLFSCNPDLIDSIRAQDLPMSFRILATTPDVISTLRTQFSGLSGVESVETYDHSTTTSVDPCSESVDRSDTGDSTIVTLPPVVWPTAGEQPHDPAAAHDGVVGAFQQAWDGSSTPEQRRAAMQDGDQLAPDLDLAAANNRQFIPNMSAVIGEITFVAPDHAAVLFHLDFGTFAQADYLGYAVLEDGVWKVSRDTVCVELTYVGVSCPPG